MEGGYDMEGGYHRAVTTTRGTLQVQIRFLRQQAFHRQTLETNKSKGTNTFRLKASMSQSKILFKLICQAYLSSQKASLALIKIFFFATPDASTVGLLAWSVIEGISRGIKWHAICI